jgi:sugar lactone lactonase YvrE
MGRTMKRIFIWMVIVAGLVLIIACAGVASPTPELAATLAPSSTPTGTETPVPQPSATLEATVSPVKTNPQIITLADHLAEPDDLLLAPDGSIYLSDVGDGTVRRYTQAGGLQPFLLGLSVPEGMVMLPDGSLVIAEQGKNRLVRYDPVTQMITPFLDLRNTTGQEGVDGLAWDASSQTIILPDSPNGTILRVSQDGQSVTEIASGFARPTGAWVEPDGSILVVDENGNSLSRVHPDGSIENLGAFSIPDDVIEDSAGNIFVVTIGDNAVHFISAMTHQDTVLAGQIIDPQGITFDADGNLVVTDPGNHRLIKLVIH